jgi:hypothetical protein
MFSSRKLPLENDLRPQNVLNVGDQSDACQMIIAGVMHRTPAIETAYVADGSLALIAVGSALPVKYLRDVLKAANTWQP